MAKMASKPLFESSFSSFLFILFAMANFTNTTWAQTWSYCNPTNTTVTCKPNPALGIQGATFDFVNNTLDTDVWNVTAGQPVSRQQGLAFTVNKRGDAPTMQTNWYMMFGQVSVIMKAATGQGIISSIVLESDDLDEVDWEFIGNNNTHVETNYFGKGNTTSYDRAIYYPVQTPNDLFHNYSLTWTAEKLEWYIDDNLIRTLKYEDALGGQNYPQTPMNLRLGIWAGGDKDNNKYTIEWAGGVTDYDKGPYTMVVQKVVASDFSTGKEYLWGDKTGSWQSIKSVNGTSEVTQEIIQPHASVRTFTSLSQTAKIAIGGSIGGAFLIFVVFMTFFCIKQRRAGRHEKALADAEWEKNTAELSAYRKRMAEGGFAMGSGYR